MKQIKICLAFAVFLTLPSLCAAQSSQKANPASQNCVNKGGTLKMSTRGDGGQYGVCYFEDNLQCEEWALLRGNCPVGGVKVTGYSTPEAVYCAIIGGTVSSDQKECTFPKTCSTEALYNGKCCS